MKQKPTLSGLKAKISQAKQKLIREANTKGISENFGQKFERDISDMALHIAHDPQQRQNVRVEAGKASMEFSDWVASYAG